MRENRYAWLPVQGYVWFNFIFISGYNFYAIGYWDIGYNFLVGQDGNVYEGRGWDLRGAHVRGYNSVSIGIAFIGNFSYRKPNRAAISAAKRLINCGVAMVRLLFFLQPSNWRFLLSSVHTVAEKWDCRMKVRLSQKSAIVAENGETTAKFGDCRTVRQSYFCATVSLFCDSVDRALYNCGGVQYTTPSAVFLAVARVIFFSGAKSQNFRPQYLGQRTAYGHTTYVTLQNAVKKWGYLSGLGGQGPRWKSLPWYFLWSN